ncbi:MAG: hypothetical protein KY410_01090 [Proteobacteria bacterium]|nr:hypothetical protein [Pseudomonadota bacterium]
MSTAFTLDERQQETKGKLVRLVVRILRPLVRLLLRHGMSCQEFTEISRWMYVDVAMRDREFALKSRSKQFKSRAAVITGLSRKEVLRLLDFNGPEELEDIQPQNRAARVLGGWTENPMFCEGKDKPKVLPIKGGTGSFHDLVRLYSGDVPPRAVLDELRRCGAVEIIDGDSVRLKRFAYFPQSGDAAEIDFVASFAGDLLDTMDYNFRNNAGPGEGKPIRQAFSRQLPESELQEVRTYIRKELEGLSRKVHHFVSEREDKVTRSGKHYYRAGLGLYYFES